MGCGRGFNFTTALAEMTNIFVSILQIQGMFTGTNIENAEPLYKYRNFKGITGHLGTVMVPVTPKKGFGGPLYKKGCSIVFIDMIICNV